MQSKARSYVFTWNNPPPPSVPFLSSLFDQGIVRYLCYGNEIAPSTGTPHLQGYVYFTSPRTLSSVIKLFPKGPHIEVAKGSVEHNTQYCSKEGDFHEFGTRPMSQQEKGVLGKRSYDEALGHAKNNELDKIPSRMLVTHYRTWKQIAIDYAKEPECLDGVCGVWIFGQPGVGKTQFCRKEYPGHYIKGHNKWWDSYQGQDVVVYEDADPTMKWLVPFLKLWADSVPFQAEMKGGSRILRPKKFVVTSQYSLRECFHDIQETEKIALARRFEEREMF